MGNLTVLNNIIEENMMNMHTAFVGKILSVKGNSATVQPLNRVKQYGKKEQAQSVLKDVPILNHARWKYKARKLEYVKNVSDHVAIKDSIEIVEREEIGPGDIVFCMCADRDITETKNGSMATPSVGRHHNMSDAVIVGHL